ncbi:MAG: SAM-dependent methyltransferase, partial [Bacteroidota bacterium]
MIWKLQRAYFEEVGIDAWRSGELPHYITSNPVMAQTYAELVLALLQDLSLRGQTEETVYILELGAGHGRLCYHFFKHFERFYLQHALPLPPICYIISDVAESNLDFCQRHPRLQPYIQKRWLDFSCVDAETSEEIYLRQARTTIKEATLAQPLVVIANYFFDSIPQKLLYFEEEQIHQVFLSLQSTVPPDKLTPAEQLQHLKLDYTYEQIVETYDETSPSIHHLIASYRGKFQQTHMLFPHVGILCLARLHKLSKQGWVVLTADKGQHQLALLDSCSAPELTLHGSFSLGVNYHAFITYMQHMGGLAYFPTTPHAFLDIGCMLSAPEYTNGVMLQHTFERFVQQYSPDDFFLLKKLVEKHIHSLDLAEIMAICRLSKYDARLFL